MMENEVGFEEITKENLGKFLELLKKCPDNPNLTSQLKKLRMAENFPVTLQTFFHNGVGNELPVFVHIMYNTIDKIADPEKAKIKMGEFMDTFPFYGNANVVGRTFRAVYDQRYSERIGENARRFMKTFFAALKDRPLAKNMPVIAGLRKVGLSDDYLQKMAEKNILGYGTVLSKDQADNNNIYARIACEFLSELEKTGDIYGFSGKFINEHLKDMYNLPSSMISPTLNDRIKETVKENLKDSQYRHEFLENIATPKVSAFDEKLSFYYFTPEYMKLMIDENSDAHVAKYEKDSKIVSEDYKKLLNFFIEYTKAQRADPSIDGYKGVCEEMFGKKWKNNELLRDGWLKMCARENLGITNNPEKVDRLTTPVDKRNENRKFQLNNDKSRV